MPFIRFSLQSSPKSFNKLWAFNKLIAYRCFFVYIEILAFHILWKLLFRRRRTKLRRVFNELLRNVYYIFFSRVNSLNTEGPWTLAYDVISDAARSNNKSYSSSFIQLLLKYYFIFLFFTHMRLFLPSIRLIHACYFSLTFPTQFAFIIGNKRPPQTRQIKI